MIVGRPIPEIKERSLAIRNAFTVQGRDDIRKKLFLEQNGMCAVCGSELQGVDGFLSQIDHATPVRIWAESYIPIDEAIRYANSEDNLALVHVHCNFAKNRLDLIEFMERVESGEISLSENMWTAKEIQEKSQQLQKVRSDAAKKWWAEKTPQELEKESQNRKERWHKKCPEKQREFGLKSSARMKNFWSTLAPMERSARVRKTNETLGAEGRRERTRKGRETIGLEGRREISRKAQETLGPEGRRQIMLKAHRTRGPQRRSEIARKREEAMGPEKRKQRADERWAKMSPERRAEVLNVLKCARWNISRGKPCTCGQHRQQVILMEAA